jgi:hypothetical protein
LDSGDPDANLANGRVDDDVRDDGDGDGLDGGADHLAWEEDHHDHFERGDEDGHCNGNINEFFADHSDANVVIFII